MMDLGATICLARKPACEMCPVAELCRARLVMEDEARPTSMMRERRADYAATPPPRRVLRGRLVQFLRELDTGQTLELEEASGRLQPGECDSGWLVPIARGLEADGLVEIVAPSGRGSLTLRLAGQ